MGKVKSTPQQEYFDLNKDVKTVFGTSDGYLFAEKQFAIGHADSLPEGENEVETFVNPLFIDGVDQEEA